MYNSGLVRTDWVGDNIEVVWQENEDSFRLAFEEWSFIGHYINLLKMT